MPSSPESPEKPGPAEPTPVWNPLEAVFAFLVPGLGHVLLGERQRGLLVGGFIMLLFVMGLLIGGVAVLDNSSTYGPFSRWGEIFLGPAYAVEWVKERTLQKAEALPVQGQALSPQAWTYTPSYGRMEEQGVLYIAVAGLLNLLAILDVVYRPPWRGGKTAADRKNPPFDAEPAPHEGASS